MIGNRLRARRISAAAAGDTTAPTIISAVEVAQPYDPYLFYPRAMVVRVTFSEAMNEATGSGTRIAIDCGGVTRYATFSSWESSTVALYVWLVDATDHDEDGLSMSSPLQLNGGTLTDLAGNTASPLTFTPPDLSTWRVVMRGMIWATDFTQGADAQKLYATVGGTQISASTGTRGTGSGSDGADPTWNADDGAEFDVGGQYFTSIPYSGILDKIDNPGVYSLYGYVYISSNTPKRMTIFTSVGGGSDWAAGGTEFALYSDGRVTATNNHALSGTYIITPDVAWRTVGWHSCAWVSDGTTVKFYWDGVLDSHTFTGYNATTLQATASNVRIGDGEFGMTNMVGSKMRFFGVSNVAHTADEVAANHAYFATL